MAASPLPCSLIEFYRHINNSQAAERERETERQIIDAGVYRWRLRRFHKRVCKGLWGTIAPSTQMEGTVAKKRLPQDTREYTQTPHSSCLLFDTCICWRQHAFSKISNHQGHKFDFENILPPLFFFITSLYHLVNNVFFTTLYFWVCLILTACTALIWTGSFRVRNYDGRWFCPTLSQVIISPHLHLEATSLSPGLSLVSHQPIVLHH